MFFLLFIQFLSLERALETLLRCEGVAVCSICTNHLNPLSSFSLMGSCLNDIVAGYFGACFCACVSVRWRSRSWYYYNHWLISCDASLQISLFVASFFFVAFHSAFGSQSAVVCAIIHFGNPAQQRQFMAIWTEGKCTIDIVTKLAEWTTQFIKDAMIHLDFTTGKHIKTYENCLVWKKTFCWPSAGDSSRRGHSSQSDYLGPVMAGICTPPGTVSFPPANNWAPNHRSFWWLISQAQTKQLDVNKAHHAHVSGK